MAKPTPAPKKPTLESLTQELADLRHDMATCGFNSYGVKRPTYFSWLNRAEQIHAGLTKLSSKKPTPPPVPAQV